MSADLGNNGKARTLRQIGTTGNLRMARMRDLLVGQISRSTIGALHDARHF